MDIDDISPMPRSEPAGPLYLAAIIFLLPAFIVWSFSSIFLMPKLEAIWHQAGLEHSKAQWLLDSSRLLKDNGRWAIAAVVVLFVALEARVRAWPRCRKRALFVTVFILNTAVLVGLTILCISAFLAIPLLTKTH